MSDFNLTHAAEKELFSLIKKERFSAEDINHFLSKSHYFLDLNNLKHHNNNQGYTSILYLLFHVCILGKEEKQNSEKNPHKHEPNIPRIISIIKVLHFFGLDLDKLHIVPIGDSYQKRNFLTHTSIHCIELIPTLLELGANVNVTDGGRSSALYLSYIHNQDNAALLTLLLDHGADPTISDTFNRNPMKEFEFSKFYKDYKKRQIIKDSL